MVRYIANSILLFVLLTLTASSILSVEPEGITMGWRVKNRITLLKVPKAGVVCQSADSTRPFFIKAEKYTNEGGEVVIEFDSEDFGLPITLTVRSSGYRDSTFTDTVKQGWGSTLWLTPSLRDEVSLLRELRNSILILGSVEASDNSGPLNEVKMTINTTQNTTPYVTRTDSGGHYCFEAETTLSGKEIQLALFKDRYYPEKRTFNLERNQKVHRFNFDLVPCPPVPGFCDRLKPMLLAGGVGGIMFTGYYDRVDSSWPWDEGKWVLLVGSCAAVGISFGPCEVASFTWKAIKWICPCI